MNNLKNRSQVFHTSNYAFNLPRRDENWKKTNYVQTQSVRINEILVFEVLKTKLESNFPDGTGIGEGPVRSHPNL